VGKPVLQVFAEKLAEKPKAADILCDLAIAD